MNVGDNYHGLKLLAYCGGGAYGEVFYCEDLTHKKMAVKILSKQKIGDHWKRELKGITNYRRFTVDVPNLLQIFQVGEDEEYFYYTMESADSLSSDEYKADTLAARLEKRAIPDKDIFAIVSHIFNGIKAIHDAGFSHRDIKPDNILFVNGIPKLADLGLLSSLNVTMTALAGTFEFIPPEIRSSDQVESHDNNSRQKCDLYAFGKVIYSMITGLDVQFFPSLPAKLSFSLPVKLFLHLSLELCTPVAAKRLSSISAIEKTLSEIERKLIYGETWQDKLKYAVWQSNKYDKSEINELRQTNSKTWTFIFALLIAVLQIEFLPEGFIRAFRIPVVLYIILTFFLFWLCSYTAVDIIKKIIRLFRYK